MIDKKQGMKRKKNFKLKKEISLQAVTKYKKSQEMVYLLKLLKPKTQVHKINK